MLLFFMADKEGSRRYNFQRLLLFQITVNRIGVNITITLVPRDDRVEHGVVIDVHHRADQPISDHERRILLAIYRSNPSILAQVRHQSGEYVPVLPPTHQDTF